jgi:hypothetical protein
LFYRNATSVLVSQLARAYAEAGLRTELLRIGDQSAIGANVIMLVDVNDHILSMMTEDEFLVLQKILPRVTNIQWVTYSSTCGDVVAPEHAMTMGLLRIFQHVR